MISVGIDVSKGKSTVCVMKPYGEVVLAPFEVNHSRKGFDGLDIALKRLDGEIRIVMEATGIYHLPVLGFLMEKGYFVSVVNPYAMKKFAKDNSIRGAKTDRLDSIMIAGYGIEKWYKLERYKAADGAYEELKTLGRSYSHYMEQRVRALQELEHLLDYTMPGIYSLFSNQCNHAGKDKLTDFVERFWHFDLIAAMNREDFEKEYLKWAEEKKYRRSRSKADLIYDLASDGIPTLRSSTPSTKMLVQEAVTVLRTIDSSLSHILTLMAELAKTLPEYSVVLDMEGVGDVLASRLIAEIGDIRRFHSAKALVAAAGIDPPPYESGRFVGTHRRITKRGSANLRKTGYDLMRVLKSHKSHMNGPVITYILKKEAEGKNKKLAKIAGLNKFLRIYYAKVSAVYKTAARGPSRPA